MNMIKLFGKPIRENKVRDEKAPSRPGWRMAARGREQSLMQVIASESCVLSPQSSCVPGCASV